MAVSFSRFSLWPLRRGAKEKEPVPNPNSHSTTNLAADSSSENSNARFPNGNNKIHSRRKWQQSSREQRRNFTDKEFDYVLVPANGVSLSGSEESDGSDWSIGWLEPHGPQFPIDDEDEHNSNFAAIVRCYRHESMEGSSDQFLGAIKNLPYELAADSNNYVKQWLSSLHN